MDGRPLSPEQKLGQDLAFQAIDSATKQVLSDEEKAELKALFELVDVDANGKVTRSELLKAITSSSTVKAAAAKHDNLRPLLHPQKFSQNFKTIDENGDKRISFEEFLAFFSATARNDGGEASTAAAAEAENEGAEIRDDDTSNAQVDGAVTLVTSNADKKEEPGDTENDRATEDPIAGADEGAKGSTRESAAVGDIAREGAHMENVEQEAIVKTDANPPTTAREQEEPSAEKGPVVGKESDEEHEKAAASTTSVREEGEDESAGCTTEQPAPTAAAILAGADPAAVEEMKDDVGTEAKATARAVEEEEEERIETEKNTAKTKNSTTKQNSVKTTTKGKKELNKQTTEKQQKKSNKPKRKNGKNVVTTKKKKKKKENTAEKEKTKKAATQPAQTSELAELPSAEVLMERAGEEARESEAFPLSAEDMKNMPSEQVLETYAMHHYRFGKKLEAIRFFERALIVKKEKFGLKDVETIRTCEELCKLCNGYAMECLGMGNLALCRELLKKVDILTSPRGCLAGRSSRLRLRAVTYSNMGCLFKERGELRSALRFLNQALEIEAAHPYCDNPARTHLNICAVYSQLGAHDKALGHGKAALALIKFEASAAAEAGGEDGPAVRGDGTSMLAITHYNIAVECEYQKMFYTARMHFGRASEQAESDLGADSPVASGMRRARDDFELKFSREKDSARDRPRPPPKAAPKRGNNGGRGRISKHH